MITITMHDEKKMPNGQVLVSICYVTDIWYQKVTLGYMQDIINDDGGEMQKAWTEGTMFLKKKIPVDVLSLTIYEHFFCH